MHSFYISKLMDTSTYICAYCKAPFTARIADRARGWARACNKSHAAKLRGIKNQNLSVDSKKMVNTKTHDLKVGQTVLVINPGGLFASHKDWATFHNLTNWERNRRPRSENSSYVVITSGPSNVFNPAHEYSEHIYGVRCTSTLEEYIYERKSLELVRHIDISLPYISRDGRNVLGIWDSKLPIEKPIVYFLERDPEPYACDINGFYDPGDISDEDLILSRGS